MGPQQEATRNCNVPAWGCLLTLLGQNLDEQVIYPRYYLGASLELIALMIVVSFGVTLTVDPDQIWLTDAVWMLCLFSVLWGTPPEPPLKMTCELVSSDDEIKLMA